MSNDLSITSLGDTIRDKVRKAMFDAVPEATMDGIIKREFDEYFKKTQYHNGLNISPFQKQVQIIMEEILRSELNAKLHIKLKDAMSGMDGENPNAVMKDLAEMLAPDVLRGIMRNISINIVNEIRNNMR